MRAKLASTILCHLVLATVMVFPSRADTGTLAYEGFDYPSGNALDGGNGGFGWLNEWMTPQPPAATVTQPGLLLPTTIPQPPSTLPVIGNAFTEQSLIDARLARRTLNTSPFTTLDRDGNVGIWKDGHGTDIWFSFLAQDHNTAVNPGLIWGGLRLYPTSQAAANGIEDLFIGKLANPMEFEHRWGFGVNVSATGHADPDPTKTAILPAPIVQGQTYLFVGHVETLETIEKVSLYVNPSTVDFAPAAPDAEIVLPSGKFRFFKLDLEVGESGGDFTFDELVFGRDYKSVALTFDPAPRTPAPVPEPASGGLLGLGALFVAVRRWRNAPHA